MAGSLVHHYSRSEYAATFESDFFQNRDRENPASGIFGYPDHVFNQLDGNDIDRFKNQTKSNELTCMEKNISTL
ncbi:MAG: hypothetical protein UX11_C0007G0046 [Candidatus Collierbacteria bacterium GW2011_GWC2_45_40]|nr:MAG: hypothetical protein UX11_C0007G0046 [Candidatus Collierbacteria bacterium GW2011_GWC2_45_40]